MYRKILLILIIISFAGCGSDSSNNPAEIYGVKAAGIVKRQGTTTYMYGTHVLIDGDGRTLYALKSDNINLDNYIDKRVMVKGDLVDGYPVDGGPNYLNVKSVE